MAQVVVELAGVERFRVERAADPHAAFVMLRMSRVGEDVEQLAVARGPAAVLRWAGAPTANARGHGDLGRGHHLLDNDLVVPSVAEVVGVSE